MQKFRQKYEPLLDRMRVAEGGKSPEQIFAGLDENTNGIIDGKELQELAEKVGVALKTPRPAPDRGSGDEPDSAPDKGLDELIKKATEQGDQSPMQFEKMAKSSAKEMGKNAFQLFQELDLDKSGALSAEELKGYKSLLYTGKTHADRAGERTWRDHASRDPRKAPKVGKAGGNDLTFAEFEEMYKDRVTNEKQPHGHHKAFLAYVDWLSLVMSRWCSRAIHFLVHLVCHADWIETRTTFYSRTSSTRLADGYAPTPTSKVQTTSVLSVEKSI
eukprot:COSAG02_NODE_2180_length_9587_cov_3.009275_4_plen_273_part_00